MEKLKTFDVDLKRLFFEVLKRLWLILLVGIICGAGAFAYAKFFITPQYKATATIYIQNYTGENDEKIYSSALSASQNLVTTYQGLLTSDNVLNRVKEKLGENYSVDAIRASFTAEAVEDTPILKISVSDHDPEEAAKIVNEIAKVAPDAIMNLVEGSSVKVVDFSRVPTGISYPSYKKVAVIGCVLGAGLTLAIIVLLVLFNSYIEGEEDITKLFDAPVIGKIPDFTLYDDKGERKKAIFSKMKLIRRKHKVSSHHSPSQRKYILGDNTSFIVDEAYNTLRSNIVFSMPGKGCKVVEFTSCGMSDGKSINALNTAITFAETNVKVLLIDCDLRRPNINRLLERKSSPGLTNVLVNACSLDDAIVRIDDYSLDVIFSGYLPPNPSELLSSEAFAELMETLKARYDYIFIDTPPVAAVIDAAVISKHTNGAVVVVRPGTTKKEELVNVVSQLEFADAKVVGFVLNCVDDEHSGYYYRGKYKYNYTYAYVHGAENAKSAKNTKSSSRSENQKTK